MKATDYRAWIHPLRRDCRYDYRIVVQRLTDGVTRHEKISGGWELAVAVAQALAAELGCTEQL